MSITEPSKLYAVAVGGVLLLLFLMKQSRWFFKIAMRFGKRMGRHCIFIILKHVIYPMVLRKWSRAWVLAQLIYWAGTGVCTFLATHGLSDIGKRAGNIALINFIPLILNGRVSLLSDLLGFPLPTYIRLHSTFGVMACVQSLLHTSIAIHEQGWNPRQDTQFYGIIAISGMALSILVIVIRKWAYEIFSNLHFGSAILILIASWKHLRIQSAFSQLCLLIGSVILITTTVWQGFMLLFRNINSSKVGSRAQINRVENGKAAQLIIPINRPFAVKPGMVLYLWIPGVSLFSIFQSHPFFIGWWDNDSDGKASSITLLVGKQNGFTRRLIEHSAGSFLTWIEGPYSTTQNIDQYNRALLVATGIGIAAQLSYIRCLVETNMRGDVRRDIYVAWEVDRESDLDWVYEWMDQLLKQDQGLYNLCFGIYVPWGTGNSRDPEPWNSQHGRIFKIPGRVHVNKVIPQDFWNHEGKALITVSADEEIRNELLNIASVHMTGIVDVVNLAFTSSGSSHKINLAKKKEQAQV